MSLPIDPVSAWSDDEDDSAEALRAMDEWVDEVNRLLGGTARRPASSAVVKPSVRQNPCSPPTPLRFRNISFPTSPISERGVPSPLTPISESSPCMVHRLTPGRSPPVPPRPGKSVQTLPSTNFSKSVRPEVPWRRYQPPLPPQTIPPCVPLPDRPMADDVPLDMEDPRTSVHLPYIVTTPTKTLPSYLRSTATTRPIVLVQPPSVGGTVPTMTSTPLS